jgi:hypothetical protein
MRRVVLVLFGTAFLAFAVIVSLLMHGTQSMQAA